MSAGSGGQTRSNDTVDARLEGAEEELEDELEEDESTHIGWLRCILLTFFGHALIAFRVFSDIFGAFFLAAELPMGLAAPACARDFFDERAAVRGSTLIFGVFGRVVRDAAGAVFALGRADLDRLPDDVALLGFADDVARLPDDVALIEFAASAVGFFLPRAVSPAPAGAAPAGDGEASRAAHTDADDAADDGGASTGADIGASSTGGDGGARGGVIGAASPFGT